MRLTWETVVIVLAVVGGVVILTVLGKDVAALLGLATTILGAVLLSNVREVKQQTNGTVTALTEELAATRRVLGDLAKTTVPADVARDIAHVNTPEG